MAETSKVSSPAIARFDGTDAWASLTSDQRDRIGALALELVNVWQLIEMEGPGLQSALPPALARAASQADHIVCAALEEAVLDALPEGAFLAEDGTPRIPTELGGICRACGCSQEDACEGGCAWATPDLCTACVDGGAGHAG